MSSTAYKVLGWAVWQIGSRVAKKKMAENRAKLGAAAMVVAVVAAGVAAAKAGSGD